MSPGEPRARRLVEARLGRPPQDALEAAVVLEAWAGVPAQRALETARALMPRTPAAPLVSAAAPVTRAAPAGARLGGRRVPRDRGRDRAVGRAALGRARRGRRRTGAADRAAAHRRRCSRRCTRATSAARRASPAWPRVAARSSARRSRSSCVLALALGQPGLLAGLLTVTWTGGTILIRRGWALAYCVPVARRRAGPARGRAGAAGGRRGRCGDGPRRRLGAADHGDGNGGTPGAGAGRSARA